MVTDVYGAGEEPEPGVTGRLIADSIIEKHPGRQLDTYFEDRPCKERRSDASRGDTVITMGAGDITRCAREILEILAGKDS